MYSGSVHIQQSFLIKKLFLKGYFQILLMNPWDDEILSILALNDMDPVVKNEIVGSASLVEALIDLRRENLKKCNLEVLSQRKKMSEYKKSLHSCIAQYQKAKMDLVYQCLDLLLVSTKTVEDLLKVTPGIYIHMEASYHRHLNDVLKTASSFLSNFNHLLNSAAQDTSVTKIVQEIKLFLLTYM